MKAPQYVFNNPELSRFNKHKMTVHLSKLKEIRERKHPSSSTPCPQIKTSKKFQEDRKIYTEKKLEIYKDNRALFGKLLSISQNYSKVFDRNFAFNRNSFRSSYEISRKNQERKIAIENEKIVKKLTEAQPVLRKKTLDQEYSEYKKRKRMILKIASFDKSFDSDKQPAKSFPYN